MLRTFTRTYLEMYSPADLRPGMSREPSFKMQQVTEPSPEFCRFLYTAVGGDYYWLDRLSWTHARWLEHLLMHGREVWFGTVHGIPAGFFELEPEAEGVRQIVYLGLLKQFAGRGLGGAMLTVAINRAWQTGARVVALNTCSLDSAVALVNYKARGFKVVREVQLTEDLPEHSPGIWSGADRT